MPKSTLATSTIKGTKIDQLLYKTSAEIGSTFTAFSCNWQDYDLLIFTARFYSNETSSLITPKFNFASTREGTAIFIYDASSTVNYQAYQNGEGSVKLATTTSDSTRRLIIYGIKFK